MNRLETAKEAGIRHPAAAYQGQRECRISGKGETILHIEISNDKGC